MGFGVGWGKRAIILILNLFTLGSSNEKLPISLAELYKLDTVNAIYIAPFQMNSLYENMDKRIVNF